MKKEKLFCDRCKKEIVISSDINDEWLGKKFNLCVHCHSEFKRFLNTKDTKKFEMERKYYGWREASLVLGFFLTLSTTIIIILVNTGVCR